MIANSQLLDVLPAIRRRSTMQNVELAPPIELTLPSRWTIKKSTSPQEDLREIETLSKIIVEAADAVTGVYMRLCDRIRTSTVPEKEIRTALEKHFPQSRASELMRVARAPEDIYLRYTAGFFGFKAALKHCRLYSITPGDELRRRQLMRAAHRILELIKPHKSIKVNGRTITIT